MELHGTGEDCEKFMENLRKKAHFFLQMNPSLYEYDMEKSSEEEHKPAQQDKIPSISRQSTVPAHLLNDSNETTKSGFTKLIPFPFKRGKSTPYFGMRPIVEDTENDEKDELLKSKSSPEQPSSEKMKKMKNSLTTLRNLFQVCAFNLFN